MRVTYVVIKRESWCQVHRHFTRAFFVRKCFAQLFSTYILALFFLAKAAHKILMKLTIGVNFIDILYAAFAPVDLH